MLTEYNMIDRDGGVCFRILKFKEAKVLKIIKILDSFKLFLKFSEKFDSLSISRTKAWNGLRIDRKILIGENVGKVKEKMMNTTLRCIKYTIFNINCLLYSPKMMLHNAYTRNTILVIRLKWRILTTIRFYVDRISKCKVNRCTDS